MYPECASRTLTLTEYKSYNQATIEHTTKSHDQDEYPA